MCVRKFKGMQDSRYDVKGRNTRNQNCAYTLIKVKKKQYYSEKKKKTERIHLLMIVGVRKWN